MSFNLYHYSIEWNFKEDCFTNKFRVEASCLHCRKHGLHFPLKKLAVLQLCIHYKFKLESQCQKGMYFKHQ